MDKDKRKPLFSVTIKDCDVETFRGSGPGGQNRNKVSSGVRITHRASGAVGKATEDRSQNVNKKMAWERMGKSEKFQNWARVEVARRLGAKTVDELVEETMTQENIKTEVLDQNQKWQVRKPEELTDESGAVRLSVNV